MGRKQLGERMRDQKYRAACDGNLLHDIIYQRQSNRKPQQIRREAHKRVGRATRSFSRIDENAFSRSARQAGQKIVINRITDRNQ